MNIIIHKVGVHRDMESVRLVVPFLLVTLFSHHGIGQICQVSDGLEQAFLEGCTQEGINNATCGQAWLAFSSAFSSVNPTEVTIDDYDGYFNVIPIRVRADSVLFWSGTETLVRFIAQETDNPICTSFTEPASKIIDGLGDMSWCSEPHSNPSTKFWASFSRMLGQTAEGIVFWTTTTRADRDGVYYESSFFGMYELPALEAPRVQRMVVINVHPEGVGEACGGEETLHGLENIVESKMLSYHCIDVYGDPTSQDMAMQKALADKVYEIIEEERSCK